MVSAIVSIVPNFHILVMIVHSSLSEFSKEIEPQMEN